MESMIVQSSTADGPIDTNLMLFSWIDYTLFGSMLAVSAFIGIYYGCFGSKQSTTGEYLHGGKTMRILPIAASLTASHLSSITVLGVPSEIYFYGTQFALYPISVILIMFSIIYVFLPVFYELQLVSTYEYLSLRFDNKVRKMASLLFILLTLFYIPIVIYAPSLAFNQVTGVELYKIYPIVCGVCIFYTTLGGLKAAVLSDTIQFFAIIVSLITVLVMGMQTTGSLEMIWEHSANTDRIEFFNFDPDPTVRTTVWGILFGLTSIWMLHYATHPSSVQRFLAVPSLKAAKRSVMFFTLAVILSKAIICFFGLIMFAKYSGCDPLSAGKINKPDQILPYFVQDTVGSIPGLSGLFTAGLFSTALSTMSTSVITLAGTIYEDFIKVKMPVDISEKRRSNIMKFLAAMMGVLSVAMVFVIERLGGILHITISLPAITAGPLLGLFVLGMLFPTANAKGALSGGILSTIFVAILVGGSHMYNTVHPYKPLSTSNCDFNVTLVSEIPAIATVEKNFSIFLISHYYFSFIGVLLVVLIGLLVSWITKRDEDPYVDYTLLSPCIYWLLPKNPRKLDAVPYHSVEIALNKTLTTESCANGKEKCNGKQCNGNEKW